MIVNDRHRFVFVHIPKTAGTSLRAALGALDGTTTAGVGESWHETPQEFLGQYRARTGEDPDHVKDYRFLCFVRHPVDRFASLHRYLISKHRHTHPEVPLSLNRFVDAVVEDAAWTRTIRSIRPQCLYTEGVSPWIGRFETLEEDFRALNDLLGVSMSLGHRNATTRPVSAFTLSPRKLLGKLKRARRSARYVSEDLSPQSRRRLEAHYARDFEDFGY